MPSGRGPVIVPGTDTGVGKTVVTAAIAAAATQAGLRVAVLKPAQTGGDCDAGVVRRRAAPTTVDTMVAYPDPLAPLTAARVADAAPLVLGDVLSTMERLAGEHELVLVEGAGGLLVPLGGAGWTAADLAVAVDAPAVVVVRAGL